MQAACARSHQALLLPRRAVPTVQAWRAEEHEEKSGCRADERGQSALAAVVVASSAAMNAVSTTTSFEVRIASTPGFGVRTS